MYGYAGGYAGSNGMGLGQGCGASPGSCGCGCKGGMGELTQGNKSFLTLFGLGVAFWLFMPRGR